MPKILGFGDSYTQGVGLSHDTPPPSTTNKDKLAWPNQLSLVTGLPAENHGWGGASNKAIVKTILNTPVESDDYVFIMWSDPGRTSYLTHDSLHQHWHSDVNINPWGDDHLSEFYYKHLYSEGEEFFSNLVLINFINSYLVDKGVSVYHLLHDNEVALLNIFEHSYNSAKITDILMDDDLGEQAVLGHYHPRYHASLAQRLSKLILDKQQ